ncbi:MAG: hypothetical protein HYS64_02200, partial [Rhodospirillales bacterium]|nr:hypothetical protein [Rhodospirillales bacterium]
MHWFLGIAAALLLIAQPAQAAGVSVQAYPVPAGAHPHDVAPAPDGTVWYTAQRQGALGRLDPKTGKTEHVPLGQGSAPHGVVVGADGLAWVTDSGLNAMVSVDPKTLKVRVYPLPGSSGYANMNTPAIDAKGLVWFTGQSGVYGRVDPKTSEVKVFKAPRGRGPYGMDRTPDGVVWFSSLAGSYIARVDSATGKAEVFDGFISHVDEVTHLPPGAVLLASNAFTRVQAVAVRQGPGVFWGLQYHPEYDLHELARLTFCRIDKLTAGGFFRDRAAATAYVENLE